MNKKTVIITGGSSGIGKALVHCYAEKGYEVFSIARSESSDLMEGTIRQYCFDLSRTGEVESFFSGLLDQIDLKSLSSLTLINNAGTLGTISRIEKIAPEAIQSAIALNFTAPMILSGLFIKACLDLNITKKIINISSSAAINPRYGWSTYCTTKSALDMMVKTIGLEQQYVQNPVKIFSVYPGVVETAMQVLIRNTSEDDFKDVQRFIDLKQHDQLAKPEDVADQIFYLDQHELFQSGGILDLRKIQ